jgi:hypothetical protein
MTETAELPSVVPVQRRKAGRPRGSKTADERKASVRVAYISDPAATAKSLAEKCGVPWSTIQDWITEGGWVNQREMIGGGAASVACTALEKQAVQLLAIRQRMYVRLLEQSEANLEIFEGRREKSATLPSASLLDEMRAWSIPVGEVKDLLKLGASTNRDQAGTAPEPIRIGCEVMVDSNPMVDASGAPGAIDSAPTVDASPLSSSSLGR